MSLGRYALVVLAVLALTATIVALTLGDRLDRDGRVAAAYGAGVAAVNALLAHGLLRWSNGRSTKEFLVAVLGGMAGRMALVLLAVLVAVAVLKLPTLPLLVALIGHFAVFLGLEMVALHGAPSAGAVAR